MGQKHNNSSVRSIFISDLHLGSRFSKASEALEFLQQHQPENLYLVGDIIDAWALRRRWYWPQPYDDLLNRIAELVEDGTKLFYTPGNHDSFLRRFQVNEPPVRIQDQFIHRCANGRRFVILHGDQFDSVEGGAQWLSVVGSIAYDLLLFADRAINRGLISLGLSQRRISGTMKASVKLAVQFISGFEKRLVDHARQANCDGIICGHIHVPRYRMLGEILYVNLGDWIENSSALVEYGDGRLELLQTSCEAKPSLYAAASGSAPNFECDTLSPLAARLAHQFVGSMLQAHNDEAFSAPAGESLVA